MLFKKKPLTSKHVLISRTDNIGDVVLTLPMAARLKQINPGVRISFLCRSYTARAVRYCNSVDAVIELEDIADPAAYFRGSDIDTIIMAQPDHDLTLAAFKGGIPNRIGNARQKLYLNIFCNRRVRFSKGKCLAHEAQINFAFLRPYGETAVPAREDIPALYDFSIPADAEIDGMLAPHAFNLILHAKSNGHGREWPQEYYLALATMLQDEPGMRLWLTGSSEEGEWLARHAPELLAQPNVRNVCGRFTLAELTIFIKHADGLIASGTGPLHLSAAIGQRTLGLFPPTRPMHPGRWAPLGEHAQTLCVETCESNCHKSADPTCDCMRRIRPAAVHQVVKRWMREQS
ncbi:lipopolysaccharide heptosyltransferase family protein [Oxalobacteraceae bacterium CAVE-383]|nr:lipopolysaccharide heptosyltransferase family protein [Oxalobacteraceae bacterium CAVE-383]